jgi:hypothetical protein
MDYHTSCQVSFPVLSLSDSLSYACPLPVQSCPVSVSKTGGKQAADRRQTGGQGDRHAVSLSVRQEGSIHCPCPPVLAPIFPSAFNWWLVYGKFY